MTRRIGQRRDMGWTPWPKRSLRERTLASLTERLTQLPQYQRKAKELLPALPIGARLGASIMISAASGLPTPRVFSEALSARADRMWVGAIQDLQGFFFDRPWLFESSVRMISRSASVGNSAFRGFLELLDQLEVGSPERRERIRRSLPRTGYRTFMAAYLVFATAAGYFRGGHIQVRKVAEDGNFLDLRQVPPFVRRRQNENFSQTLWADQEPAQNGVAPALRLDIRHPQMPASLAECLVDIDDMYWSSAAGMVIKIVLVGSGADRRWVVIVPGTEHMTLDSEPNPADTESNVREMLGLRSAARAGVECALVAAFDEAGIPAERRREEKVLVVGHSQGGVTAHALANDRRSPIQVTHVLTVGAPSRSIPIPSHVWSVSVEHIQDMIPWMDGTPESRIDERVLLRRSLEKPASDPLYYAHDAGIYMETVKLIEMETRRKITQAARGEQPLDRTGREVLELLTMLPIPGEDVHILYYEIAQEVLPRRKTPNSGGFVAKLVPDPDSFLDNLAERASFDPYVPPDLSKNQDKDTKLKRRGKEAADTSGGKQL